jgi:hypothetical protein
LVEGGSHLRVAKAAVSAALLNLCKINERKSEVNSKNEKNQL